MVLEINITKLLRAGLDNINQSLTLYQLYAVERGEEPIPFVECDNSLEELKRKGFIKIDETGEINLTVKANNYFNIVNQEIIDCIEKIYQEYPVRTPNGRTLRAANVKINGKYTADFSNIMKKLKSIVRTEESCEQILNAIKNMVAEHNATGRANYLPQFSRVVSNKMWERYLEEDNPFKAMNPHGNIERL